MQLQWFIAEQVEEEKIAKDIVEHLKMFGQAGEALMLMDRQLGRADGSTRAAGIAGFGRLTMELNQFIEDALNQENGLLREAVDDLTAEELVWQPGVESNPIGWTLWHMLRVEDMWVQFFAQRQTEIWGAGRLAREVWTADPGQRF